MLSSKRDHLWAPASTAVCVALIATCILHTSFQRSPIPPAPRLELGGPSVPILQSYSASELLSDLEDSRSRVLHLLDGLVADQIRGIQNVSPCLLWEVGHVFFFTEFHYLRYVNISRASILSGADDLYDSSRVPGKIRWTLPLPTLEVTLKYGEDSLQLVRDHWASHGGVGAFAYLLRSATFHEDWHAESFYRTRQKFSYPAPPPAFSIRPRLAVPFNASLYVRVPGATYSVGASKEISRFVFDNEKPEKRVNLNEFQVSIYPVTNGQFLHFIIAENGSLPVYWRNSSGIIEERIFQSWVTLNPQDIVRHVTWYEAMAYCKWSKQRLPTEEEWEVAYPHLQGVGQVWEWTSSIHYPYEGFAPDPYVDYSKPSFGITMIVRGASVITTSRMISPTLRNFFAKDRSDVMIGFRTVVQP